MIIWMYVLREFEDALDDCQDGCINCNDDPVHAWDEGVAFYTGSAHGTMAGTTDPGWLIYSLANKRCANFKTCGVSGDLATGNAKVNFDLFALFDTGRTQLENGQCAAARITKNKVAQLMAVPALQGTLRYAYITGPQAVQTPKAIGEGAVFAASVLPIVHDCSPADAQIIYNNMQVNSATTDWMAVKMAFERNYECMGITCKDVGGYWDDAIGDYFSGAAPCADEPLSSIAGYAPGSQVTDHVSYTMSLLTCRRRRRKLTLVSSCRTRLIWIKQRLRFSWDSRQRRVSQPPRRSTRRVPTASLMHE